MRGTGNAVWGNPSRVRIPPSPPRSFGGATDDAAVQEPLEKLEPGPRVVPEPPRRGEPGGEPCAICAGERPSQCGPTRTGRFIPPAGELSGNRLDGQQLHVDSFCDLPDDLAEEFGRAARGRSRDPEPGRRRARTSIPMGRWRQPLPRLVPAAAARLPRGQGRDAAIWEDVLPTVPDEELRAAAEKVAAAMPEQI